jgi:hypothetical protein
VEPPIENCVVEREMRDLRAILEVMEAAHRISQDVGDINEVESGEIEVEEVAGEMFSEELLLRVVFILGAKAKVEIPMYEGNLDDEELLD